MAFSENMQVVSRKVDADASSYQYHCYKMNSSGQMTLCTAAGERVDGILQNLPAAANRAGSFAIGGVAKAYVGGAVSAGDKLAVTTDGHLDDAETALYVDTSAGTAADPVIGSMVVAIALEDAGGAGVISVQMCASGVSVTAG